MVLIQDNKEFDIQFPIIIIGAGACGLCAALSANEHGIKPLILERDKEPSGSSALSTCLIPAAGTKLQKKAGIEDTPEIFSSDIINKARNENDQNMVRFIAKESAPTVDWLIDNNVPLDLVTGFFYPGHSQYRMHGSPNRTGTELMDALIKKISQKKIDLMTSALVSNIYFNSDKIITGVEITRPNGNRENVGCKSLILACNGFGGNSEMVKKYIPEMANALYFGHTGNRGDAIKWGIEIGASISDIGSYQGHGAVTHPHGTLLFWGLMTQGGFQVNIKGKRFSNEVRGYSEQAVDVISQENSYVWEIWDSNGHELGMDFVDYRNGSDLKAHKTAKDINEISFLTKIPLKSLEKTFEYINHCIKHKTKDNFGRDWSNIKKMTKPFYFAKVTGALFHTQGGLDINSLAQVLDKNGKPFPNLFAGGGAARGLSGPSRWGYLSGNGLLTAVVLGKVAGRSAAKKIINNDY
ncbi:MAG: Fumarate reductase flavoprotein subunit [Alphaproteobacteria bacterium MarineAlpha2_Bin1]|nr:MAG: Fumarate reductase flavoprotein subunit [Alphaproteobacteria bacterium MarineAlpha2_Bin1]